MSPQRQLFGTDGIRGAVGTFPLTTGGCLTLGRALAETLEGGSVIVGRDSRESGPALAAALMAGLAEGGARVEDLGVAPTPAVAYLTKGGGEGVGGHRAGIVLTASHNPFQDNGIKIFGPEGYKLTDAEELALEARILGPNRPSAATGYGQIHPARGALEAYGAALLQSLPAPGALAGLRVAVDCANGAASVIAPSLFADAGARVVPLSAAPDGRNINAGCGALHPESLGAQVRAGGMDLGVALDGDGDRCILVDERGETVNGDAIIALIALAQRDAGELPDPRVVMTSMSNLGAERYLKDRGVTLLRTNVGDRYVLARLREEGLHLGGEQSGHIIDLRRSTTGDGILTGLTVAAIMASRRQPLSALVGDIPRYPQVLLGVPVRRRQPIEALPSVRRAVEDAEAALGEGGRVVVRYSGTELLARVMVEGEDGAQVGHLAEVIAEAFRAADIQGV